MYQIVSKYIYKKIMLTYSIRILDFLLGLVKLIVYNELLNKGNPSQELFFESTC